MKGKMMLMMMMMIGENQSSQLQVHESAVLGTDKTVLRTQFK
jgi:hypothetical protein